MSLNTTAARKLTSDALEKRRNRRKEARRRKRETRKNQEIQSQRLDDAVLPIEGMLCVKAYSSVAMQVFLQICLNQSKSKIYSRKIVIQREVSREKIYPDGKVTKIVSNLYDDGKTLRVLYDSIVQNIPKLGLELLLFLQRYLNLSDSAIREYVPMCESADVLKYFCCMSPPSMGDIPAYFLSRVALWPKADGLKVLSDFNCDSHFQIWLYGAVEIGATECVEYILSKLRPGQIPYFDLERMIYTAANRNYYKILEVLLELHPSHKKFYVCLSDDNVECFKLLYQRGLVDFDVSYDSPFSYPSNDCVLLLQTYHELGCKDLSVIFYQSVKWNHHKCLQYLMEHNIPGSDRIFKQAVKKSNLEVIKYCTRDGIPWTFKRRVDESCAEYLRSLGFLISESDVYKTSDNSEDE